MRSSRVCVSEREEMRVGWTDRENNRTAIEDELEVLYDAYYEELEQYANHQQHTRIYGASNALSGYAPPEMHEFDQERLEEYVEEIEEYVEEIDEEDDDDAEDDDADDDEDEDDEEDNDEDDEEEDEEEEMPEAGSDAEQSSYEEMPYNLQMAKRTHFGNSDRFGFGDSLTVRGGILTVADDLLKNDGKKFLDMMERLAERRMQQEEKIDLEPEDGYYEEDEDEDEAYEVEDEDTRTEEQRMEEGRRMFQIFAARMFEQRVLAAYREKVARERQQRLIQELEDEEKQKEEREAKKQKEKERKKEQKRLNNSRRQSGWL
ncbi:hypothetical protein BDF14DRAFT_135114 [Spinellus fusiger]|nr:hypothetical protein BDF14DRAFT_135114 [Spinellus fusiger]